MSPGTVKPVQAQRTTWPHPHPLHSPPNPQTPSAHPASLARGYPLLVRHRGPGQADQKWPSALYQVKHRPDLHSSEPCMTPKMNNSRRERGYEANANSACFKAGRTRVGEIICPLYSILQAKLEFQPDNCFLNLHSWPWSCGGARDQWDTPRGDRVAPQDRECGVFGVL